jgi:GNAT superfamily N-acetyltransferase
MRELRSGIEGLEGFVRQIDDVQRREGYRLVAVFDGEEQEAVAVAGFRICQGLAWGRYLYVDDLSTLPEARRRGHAGELLEWLVSEARRSQCDQLHLDSGVGADRTDAHRLYLNTGMTISAHHFAMSLDN